MKKFFALSFSIIFIFALVVICFAHPVYSLETDSPTTEIEYAFDWFYVETDNLEDVIFNEFEGEESEEIRDVLVFHPDCEVIEIGGTRYIEYDSLRKAAMNEYSEDIADIITCNQDLIILTPQNIMEKHGTDEHDDTPKETITEYKKENYYSTKNKKTSFYDGVIKPIIEVFPAFCIVVFLICALTYIPDLIKKKRK